MISPALAEGQPIPEMPKLWRVSVVERLMRRTMKMQSGCWEWTGYINPGGYGMIRDGKMRSVHVVSYEFFIGEIPLGMEVHHKCFNTRCIRPVHLEARTHQGNCQETAAAGRHHCQARTKCPQGHRYSPENTGIDHRGHRFCRTCKREWIKK